MSQPTRIFTMAALCATLLSVGPARGNDLEEVYVAGRSLEDTIPLDLAQYGNRVEVIEFEDIALRGFTEVSQVLQMMVPGLHVRPKNGAFDYVDVSLQGSRREEILWLIDGVRINNRLYNGTTPLDTLPVHMIERIEVLKGGQGIFYGTQSVGGVVNVVTKSLQEEPDGEAGGGINTNEGYSAHTYYRGSGGPHRFLLYASKDEADGFRPYRDEDIQPSATDRERGYDVLVGGLKYGVDIGNSASLTLQYQHTDNELDYARPARNAYTVNERKEDIVTARLDYLPSERFGLYIKAYYHDWDTRYTERFNELDANGQLTGNVNTIYDHAFWGYEDYGLNAMAEFNLHAGFEYVLGYDMQKFSGEDDVWRIGDRKETVNALFAQVRTTPDLLPDTALALGVRYNRPDNVDDSTVWNFSGRHQIDERWYVQASAGTSFRLPDAEALFLDELYDEDHDGVPDFFFSVGNPDLKPEKSRNFNLGIGANFQRASFELIGYRRKITDYIDAYVTVFIAGVEGESFVNSDDEVEVKGAEFIGTADFGAGWTGHFSYSHSESELNDDGIQLTGIPESELKAGLDYASPDRPWGMTLTGLHVGSYTARPGIRRGHYTVLDVSAWYRFGASDAHQFSLRLENLTDEEYATRVDVATADTGGNYFYDNLGTPRTAHVFYTYRF